MFMQVTLTKCKGVLYPMCALYDSRKGTQERRGLEEQDKIMGVQYKQSFIFTYI